MLVPVCPKCSSLIEIVIGMEDKMETVRYYCAQCEITSSGFLLGYVEMEDATDEEKIKYQLPQHADVFVDADVNYKRRAQIQAIQKRFRTKQKGTALGKQEEGKRDMPRKLNGGI